MVRRYSVEKLIYWEVLESKLLEVIYLLFIYCQWVKVSRSSYLDFIQLPKAGGWLSEGIAFLQIGQILEELTAGRDLLTALSIAEQKVLPGRWWLLHLCNMFTHRLGGHYCPIFLSIFCAQHWLKNASGKIHLQELRVIHFLQASFSGELSMYPRTSGLLFVCWIVCFSVFYL